MAAFTVVFYVDACRAIEAFVEEVDVDRQDQAFAKAVAQVKRSGMSTTGGSISDEEWETANEIVTFHGHDL